MLTVSPAGPYTPQPARRSHKRCLSSSETVAPPRPRTNSIPSSVYSKKAGHDSSKFMKVGRCVSTGCLLTLFYCRL